MLYRWNLIWHDWRPYKKKRETHRHVHSTNHVTHREKMAINKPRREAWKEMKCQHVAPRITEKKFCCLNYPVYRASLGSNLLLLPGSLPVSHGTSGSVSLLKHLKQIARTAWSVKTYVCVADYTEMRHIIFPFTYEWNLKPSQTPA